MTLKQKLAISFSLILISFAIIVFFLVNNRLTDIINSNFSKNVKASAELGYSYIDSKYPGDWHIKDNILHKGSNVINGNFEVVDAIKKSTGYFVTIFQNDTRVSTNVLSNDGKRAIGTTASAAIVDTVLGKGLAYNGMAQVLGKDVIAYYMPIKDAAGKITGMWFTGIDKSDVNKQIGHIMIYLGIAILIMLIIGIFIVVGPVTSHIISAPLKTIIQAAGKIALGDLNIEININTKDEIGILATAFKKMAANIQEGAQAAERIAAGDLEVQLPVRSEKDVLNKNLNGMIANIKSLIADINMLADGASNGQLSVRADELKHSGDFRKIVAGVNRTLNAVNIPLQEASSILQQIARGNLQVCVQGEYQGDYAVMKEALNSTISTLQEYVGEITSVLTRMSEGNLNVAITGEYRGDFIAIKDSLNLILQSFNEMLGEIQNAAEQVAVGSSHISQSSQGLSQAATEQAATVEEINASVSEIANQTKKNAANATEANTLSLTAKEHAVKGDTRMLDMLHAMAEINESSATISKIIKVIDEIAFQTNILALNAAVEAARAGQSGKGFAVVAEEVRNLAGRSADAAKETTVMIEASVKKAENGTKIANETAAALNKIVESVSKAVTLVGDITSASNEQATGITQINQGINQVSQVIQTSTATAEESAAASQELTSQAEILKRMVARFKLKNGNQELNNPEEYRKPAFIAETAPKRHNIRLDNGQFGKY